MKIIKPLLIVTSLFLSQASFASDDKHEAGEQLFKTYCTVCHGASVGGMDMSKRVAPPIAAVRLHYIDTYPDEASFVQAVSGWVEKQDESKSLMRGAINKFKIMPPITVPKEDAKKIAAFIYSGGIEKPEGFEKHVEEEHGKQGMGSMRGKGMHRKGEGGRHSRSKGGMGGKMMQQLSLSPQQKQQMQILMQEKKSRISPLRQQMRQIKQSISRLDTNKANYKAQVFSLASDKAGLVYRMTLEKGEMRQKIEAVLTADQRTKLQQLRQQRRAMRKRN
jgi:Spy/CpxP family protein refolding chaperone